MTAAPKLDRISEEEYLAGELVSPIKHEYLGGSVYAMTGARNVHNLIAGNIFGFLHSRLRGSPCRPYNSDTKIRVRLPAQTRYYYPDASVICRSNLPTESFQDNPALVAEVLSRATRRIDEGEKKDAYLSIESLKLYLLVEQDEAKVIVHRCGEAGFVAEEYAGLDSVILLSEFHAKLPLSEIYDGVVFSPETDEGEEN